MNERRCTQCRHFSGGAALFEAMLPGLAALGSAQAALRAGDGYCALHDRTVCADACCAAMTPAA
jgi:hypothetical protein